MTDKKHEYPARWITTELAVGYAPRSNNDLASIRAHGITTIVNLCAECYDRYTEKLGASKVSAPELREEIEQPTDSFFKKWEAMLDWFKE